MNSRLNGRARLSVVLRSAVPFPISALVRALLAWHCTFLLALTASLLDGCVIVPLSLNSDDQAATLSATPSKTPGTGASCPVPASAPEAIADTAAPAERLNDAVSRVRNESFFGDLALAPLVNPAREFNEAALLVEKAKAVQQAKGGAVAPELAPDDTEKELIGLIPWAADTGIQLNTREQAAITSAENHANKARILIGQFAPDTKNLNTLLPPNAATPAGQAPPTPAPAGSDVHVKSLSPADRGLFKELTDLASFRAFHLLALMSAAHVYVLANDSTVGAEELDAEVRIFNVARFLSAYFDAYFRGGQFIQTTFDQDKFLTTLSSKFAARLTTTGLTADQIKPLLQQELSKLCVAADGTDSSCGTIKQGTTAFVTRAGLTVQFSGVSFAIGSGVSHTYPQVSQFGPQMVRVLVEAFFDANGKHLPAMPNATACQEHLFNAPGECVAANATPDDSVTQIDMLASAAEALSQTATGAIIRGFNVGSLNNEAVAQMLETLAGVNARKITEKVLFIESNKGSCPLTPVALSVKPAGSATETSATTTTTAATSQNIQSATK